MIAEPTYHLHLISDSTGETVNAVARACLVQFEGVAVTEHLWSLVRTRGQLEKVITAVQATPGPVIFTLIDGKLRDFLTEESRRLGIVCISVLDPIMNALGHHFHSSGAGAPGRQHAMDAEYFARIDAMHFTLAHDDGQSTHDLNGADAVLVGPSRTSKTPTCVYLANRGVKAANYPLVPNIAPPEALFAATRPLIVGLITDPERLVQIRRNRLRLLQEEVETDYTDLEQVTEEMKNARRLFTKHDWPVIDVTRRSIEETAAAIMQMLAERRDLKAAKREAEETPVGE
ncbi:MAG: pyruvate, water dikinase regulatory protein [Rhodospirillales bacterium]